MLLRFGRVLILGEELLLELVRGRLMEVQEVVNDGFLWFFVEDVVVSRRHLIIVP